MSAAVAAVFIAAVLLRLPACHESFWVDELHSAWVVWDGIEQVPARAAAGNQTPFYFYGLWFWKQMVGGSEFALRLSSVLMMSLAAAVLVVAVSRRTGRIAAGIIAGGFLAVDSNAIFFGTELRPYALVVLCATVAIALFASILHRLSNGREITVRCLLWLVAVACFAALFQPTSVGALMPLVGIACAIICWRGPAIGQRISATHWLFAGGLIVITVVALTQSAAADAWSARDNWKAFASSQQWRQMWTVWPWEPLVIWPAVPALGWAIYCGRRFPARWSAWPWLLALAISITTMTWLAARGDWIPLWHRRYMVSVLPMLAWVGGALWATVAEAVAIKTEPTALAANSAIRRLGDSLAQTVVVAAALTLLAWNQGTLDRLLARGPVLVHRQEGWREAAQWVASRRHPDDILWVAAGLIESQELRRRNPDEPLPPHRRDYLNYVVSGPYPLSDPHPIGPIRESLASNIGTLVDGDENEVTGEARSVWILARFPARKLEAILKEISKSNETVGEAIQRRKVTRFGGVTVVQIRLADPR
ncbi:MAG: glycosyltransferase family 39 protein [Pirellulaceae bacterium]